MHQRKSGLSRALAQMTVIPLVVFGIATTLFSSFWIFKTLSVELQYELETLSHTTILVIDQLYPGDYASYSDENGLLIAKGNIILNLNYDLIDQLKEKNGVEYTLFYGDLRVITTLRNEEGVRLVGTKANPQIAEKVIDQQSPAFYDNVDIYGSRYCCYYEPLYNSDGSCVGMFTTLMPMKRVYSLIWKSALPILALSVVAIFLAIIWSGKFSAEFIQVIHKLQTAFSKAARGNLSNTVPPELLARKDEFGDMSHSLIEMQAALRTLIEQDMLTQLYNRRFGQQRLSQIVEKNRGTNSHFSIALGDIDFFKKFNDTYGHDCGDLVLQTISRLLQNHVKDYGFCARWGGEEFLIILTKDSFDEHHALMLSLIEEIRKTIIPYNHMELSVTMTFGLIDTFGYEDSDTMVKVVDNLLYRGKENGRNRLVILDDYPDAATQ